MSEGAVLSAEPTTSTASLTPGTLTYCLVVNRHRHNPRYHSGLAVQHFPAGALVEIDTGSDVPLRGRVLSVERDADVWELDPTFTLKVILAGRGRVLTLPYGFVMAGHVWSLERGSECGCDEE